MIGLSKVRVTIPRTPDRAVVSRASRTLKAIGAMTSSWNSNGGTTATASPRR